uniref:protein phosphatase 1 regulatory subunit 7 isoform X2 n=1 Tax=Myxine glutinosa TaxID=7769 RepID=UPI0035901D9B
MCRVRGFSKILWCWCAPHVHVANLCSFRALTGHFRFVKRWRRPVERPHSWLFGLGGKMILDGCAIVVLEVVTPEMRKSTVDCQEESEESGDERRKERPVLAEEQGQDMPVDIGSIELDSDAEEVDLNHCRIGKIERFETLRNVRVLCLRQNVIKKIENLESLTMLQELDLNDNLLTRIENLNALESLEILDLSFNSLRKIEGLERLSKLKKLFLVNNKIVKVEKLEHLQELEMLELGSNRIRVLENFEKLLRLEELFLGKNKITKLQNLDYFANLMVLSLQSNRLTKIEGLRFLVNLQELYLSHNGIEIIEGLENNRKLTTLDIASNRIKKIENLNHLVHLQEFWMNDNLISNWNDLDELNNAKELQTIYLERNPLHQDPQYRRKIMLVLPWVQQIDATFVRI